MDSKDVEKLAQLARIKLSEEEKAKLAGDLGSILGYVSEISEVEIEMGQALESPALRNVMRDDGEPHAGGLHTEAIVAGFPQRQGNFVKVKKIL